jgi:hypothetical protein
MIEAKRKHRHEAKTHEAKTPHEAKTHEAKTHEAKTHETNFTQPSHNPTQNTHKNVVCVYTDDKTP